MPEPAPAAPDRIATDLLRIALNPSSGRIRRGGTLDIGLRAALFSDLVLAGRIGDGGGSPFAEAEEAERDTDDHIGDTLTRAVQARPYVPWWRWHRHVRVDRTALVGELVDNEVWTPAPGGPGRRYADADPTYGPGLAYEMGQVIVSGDVSDARRSVLAVLTHLTGADGRGAHPRALRRDLKGYATAVAGSGPRQAAAMRVVTSATVLMRRRTRR